MKHHVLLTGSAIALGLVVSVPLHVCAQTGGGKPANPTPVIAGQAIFDLAAFGSIGTVEQANATLGKALASIQAAGGGMLVISAGAPAAWKPENTAQEALRTPAPPAPAKSWTTGAGVTIYDARTNRIALPQMSGMSIERTYNLPQGDSAPHWVYHPMMNVGNDYISGTSNYQGSLQEAVAAGPAKRFYIESLNGLFPGQTLEVPKETGKAPTLGEFRETATLATLKVQSLGYDKAANRPYFVSDAPIALPVDSVLRARTASGAIRAETNAHTELQSFDLFTIRHHYSQGDSYLIDGRIHYMGNEYSPDGATPNGIPRARNSVVFNAMVKSEANSFRGEVESFNAAKQELRYANAKNAHTLGTGRALINMNPKKWVTAGSAYIMAPGGALLNWGSSVRSKDAPWSQEVVGQFIAIDEPSEIIPRSENVRRWWYITGFSTDASGNKILAVRRYWWGTKNSGVGISGLRDGGNYTSDDKRPKQLKYIIAPGAEVYNVADGAGNGEAESAGARQRLVKVAPHPFTGTPLDFEKGDAIEQAVGAEPFHPIPFRAWTFDQVPSIFPAPIFDIANQGDVARDSVLSTGTGWFNDIFSQEGSVRDFLVVQKDVKDSLIRFQQRTPTTQWLKTFSWNDGPAKRELNVYTPNGSLQFNGQLKLNGNGLTGLTQFGKEGNGSNFRGLGVTVPAGATSLDVVFPKAEGNANYAITVQPGWLTDHAVTTQSPTGFRVTFSTPAPAAAKLNWLLIH